MCLRVGVLPPLHWRSTTVNQQSEQLLPAIQEVLKQAGIACPDVIAVDIGPGAFTSVRMVVAVAQGLALGWGCGVVAVNSLQSMAQTLAVADGEAIVTALDARMSECYVAAYQMQAGLLSETHAPQLVSYADLATWATQVQYLIGNGADVVPNWQTIAPTVYNAQPEAAGVLAVFDVMQSSGNLTLLLPEDLQPVYVRNTVAFTSAERAAQKLAQAVA